jgi:hypothetical protein
MGIIDSSMERITKQRERDRSRWQPRRKMTRSNLGIRLKARDSRPIEEIREWLSNRFRRGPRCNVIPPSLRTHVPKNRRLLATGDFEAKLAYLAELEACCTKSQWTHIEKQIVAR